MQVGEKTAISSDSEQEKPDDKPKKEPITLKVSVFFDGTGNNRANIQARKDNSNVYQLVCRQNPTKGQVATRAGTSNASFESDFSNIALLEEHFEATQECEHYDSFYVEGVGTQDLEAIAGEYEKDMRLYQQQWEIYQQTQQYNPEHSFPPIKPKFKVDSTIKGFGMATGDTGLYAKIDSGFNKIIDWYSDLVKEKKFNKKRQYIAKLVVDVFGFSRGAATARAFIHHIKSGERVIRRRVQTRRGLRSQKTVIPASSLLLRMESEGLEVAEDALEIGFVGLFDTVSSYKNALTSDVQDLHLDAVKHARKVYHLAAAEEHRACFSLTDITSAINQGTGEEYFLPGVHSDIGGGYREAGASDVEDFKLLGQHSWLLPALSFPRGGIEMKAFAAQLEQEGWFNSRKQDPNTKQPEIQVKRETRYLSTPMGLSTQTYEVETSIEVYRDTVSNDYRRIPFNLMAEEAESNDINWKAEIKSKLKVPAALSGVDEALRTYIARVGNASHADDWFKKRNNHIGQAFDIEKLRNRHLHYSAKIAIGHWPRLNKGERTRECYHG